MLKTTCKIFLLNVVCWFFILNTCQANHVIGADISYNYVSPNQYLVKVRFFRDCASIPAPVTLSVCYQSSGCAYSGNLLLIVTGSGIELPPCPYIAPTVSTCQGGTGYGVEKYQYEGLLILPFSCDDWILNYTAPGLPGGFQNPLIPNFLVTTKIDNVNFPVNSSREFINLPVFSFCVAQPANESFSATDADGDSLVYELVPASVDSMFCPSQAMTPFPGNNMELPLSSVPWYIDPLAGWTYYIPSMIQVGSITVKVSEFRMGQLINESLFSHQLNSIGLCIISGIQNLQKTKFIIFPSTVNNFLTVETGTTGIIKIISTKGELVYKTEISNSAPDKLQVDVSFLSQGVYHVIFQNNSAVEGKTFVKF